MPIDFSQLNAPLTRFTTCRRACYDIPFLPKSAKKYKTLWKSEKTKALGKTVKMGINMGAILAKLERHENAFFTQSKQIVTLKIDTQDARQHAKLQDWQKQLAAHSATVSALLETLTTLFTASKKSQARIPKTTKDTSPKVAAAQDAFRNHLSTLEAESKKMIQALGNYQSILKKRTDQFNADYEKARAAVLQENLERMGLGGSSAEEEAEPEEAAPKFVPRAFTKAEWRQYRIRACNGSGMGKALDEWQRMAVGRPLDSMTLEDLKAAKTATNKLQAAIKTAKGKCTKSSQKNMLAALDLYARKVREFDDAGRRCKAALQSREKAKNQMKSLRIQALMAQPPLREAFAAFSKNPRVGCFEIVDTYLLCSQNQHREAVRKYGPNNDYNIQGSHNTGLRVLFGFVPPSSPEKLEKAKRIQSKLLSELAGEMIGMLESQRSQFFDSAAFEEAADQMVQQQYPLPNFRL